MTDPRRLHRDAMQMADRAIEARRNDRWVEAQSLFRQACRLESQAAMALAEDVQAEPTRSVLFRSAATLALNGEWWGFAAYLAARGLEGTPPLEIREELQEVLRSIRPEILVDDALFTTGAADGVRLERFLSASSELASALDDIGKTLAETDLAARRLSNPLAQRILRGARDGLQEYAPGAAFSLGLFGLSRDSVETWVSVPPRSDPFSEDWTAAKLLVQEQEEAVLRGHRFAASTEDLADRGVLSAETAELLRRVGVRGVAAWPVCACDDKGSLIPALVLLSLTSDPTIFADDLVIGLLRQTVSLLELGIVIGQRDERLMGLPEHERDAPQAE